MHPHVILGGTSLDLPMIEENHEEDWVFAEEEPDSDTESDSDAARRYSDAAPHFELNGVFTFSSDDGDDDSDSSYGNHQQRNNFLGYNYSDMVDDMENNIDDDIDQSGNIADDDNSNDIDDLNSNAIDLNSNAIDDLNSDAADDLNSNEADDLNSNAADDLNSNALDDLNSNTIDDLNSNTVDDDVISNPIDDASNPLVEVQEIVEVYEQFVPESGSSNASDANENDARNSEIKALQSERAWPAKACIHHSLLLHSESVFADNDLAAESRGLKKSHSTQYCPQATPDSPQDPPSPQDSPSHHDSHSDTDDDSSSGDWINPLGLGLRILDSDSDSDSPDEIEEARDTNIRHNDRYPEANEIDSNEGNTSDAIDDNFENMFIDAMFLETTNMPDLNEEQSLSVDDSTTTRRDDYWADGMTIENLHYLNGIICWDQSVTGPRVEHRDWVFYSETNGNCEVMHLALKFWNQIIAPYSDMREVVTSGNVHCFCYDCDPDADSIYGGKLY